MGKGGRPRKHMAERHPCGKVIQHATDDPVWPTNEVMERRKALLGSASARGELECPITLLGARLNADQRYAARKARRIYELFAMAKALPRVVSGQLQDFVEGSGSTGGLPREAVEEYSAAYEELRRAVLREVRWRFRLSPNRMGAASRQAWRAVHSLSQGHMPGNIDALRIGLDAVVDYYELKDQRKVA